MSAKFKRINPRKRNLEKKPKSNKKTVSKEYNRLILQQQKYESSMRDVAWKLELKRNPGEYIR